MIMYYDYLDWYPYSKWLAQLKMIKTKMLILTNSCKPFTQFKLALIGILSK